MATLEGNEELEVAGMARMQGMMQQVRVEIKAESRIILESF